VSIVRLGTSHRSSSRIVCQKSRFDWLSNGGQVSSVHEASRSVHEALRSVHEASRSVHEALRSVHEASRSVCEALISVSEASSAQDIAYIFSLRASSLPHDGKRSSRDLAAPARHDVRKEDAVVR
jgi:hypothetical protein